MTGSCFGRMGVLGSMDKDHFLSYCGQSERTRILLFAHGALYIQDMVSNFWAFLNNFTIFNNLTIFV